MKIDRKKAKADGMADHEISFVESYLQKHGINSSAALVMLGTKPLWVCQSVAEALDKLRPGCWLRQFSEQCHQTVTAEFQLPIYKQGDDLAQHLREEKDVPSALLAYAETLKAAAGMVESLAQHAEWLNVEQVNPHFIVVSGPWLVIHALIDKGLLVAKPGTDEEAEENE